MSEYEAPTYPSQRAFDLVKADLANGNELTLTHVGEVFGPDFWIMIVTALMDSQDAARAIQGAINRLARGEAAAERAN